MEPHPDYDVGVIVGRFQVHDLHQGHRDLIGYVVKRHKKVIVALGQSPTVNTRKHPLDFEARKQMLLAEYPQLNVLYIKDVNDDALWSKRLDSLVSDLCTPGQSVVLYGGRDSFIDVYSGRFPTQELIQEGHTSGTVIRREVSREVLASSEFRAGVIWASANRFPIVYTTVDVAIFNDDYTKILLGRKPDETKFRLIGGFAEPGSPSFEDDALREAREEANVILETLEYVTSYKVDDWRYRGEADKIKTLLFVATVNHLAKPEAADDIAEVRWFTVKDFDTDIVMPVHTQMVSRALGLAEQKVSVYA